MFEISLTATQETADDVLRSFIESVPQFDVKEVRQRGGNTYGRCYIYLQLTPNGNAVTGTKAKGGRPKKLTAEQTAEIEAKLREDPECNRSQLGRQYGVSYATILNIAKALT